MIGAAAPVLRLRFDRPGDYRANNHFDEIAPSRRHPQS
jgi:hypothetical protein